ncbi:MAG: aa3-type cytochrome c oxidase subunit IV [Hyphomicrobiaceae bacterium]|nr:MAG: aa3-type cytochrome c oxidase subunit IV [Hyphomicrobiaceae bacterium]
MAVETSGGHPAMDYAEHTRTYAGFVRAIIIVVALLAVLLAGMAIFLVP